MPSGRVTAGAAAPTSGCASSQRIGVGERVAREFDVGIQHELVVGARAVQHQVVRDAVTDVQVPVQVRHLDAGIGEARLAKLTR